MAKQKKATTMEDVEEVDFSVIRTSIKCGGPLIEQILNGVHYGTSEVRCLLLDECDLIIECKVCRNLFRSLANFVAHKRVYCMDAHQDSNEIAVPVAANNCTDDTVVIQPVAPEDTVQGSETTQESASASCNSTIQQLQNGTFEGTSDTFKFYTDVVDKVERSELEKKTHYIKHEKIPGNPNAVVVSVIESLDLGEANMCANSEDGEVDVTGIDIQESTKQSNSVKKDVTNKDEKVVKVNSPVKKGDNPSSQVPVKIPDAPKQDNCSLSNPVRSARLRAKFEQREKVKTEDREVDKKVKPVPGKTEANLRDRAKKMFLYPVRKTVTEAKDCDLKQKNCLICKRHFSNTKSLHYHMKCFHSSTRRVYPCPLCETVLKHRWGLTRHLMRVHELSKPEVEEMKAQALQDSVEEPNPLASPESDKSCEVETDTLEEEEKLEIKGRDKSTGRFMTRGKSALNSSLPSTSSRTNSAQNARGPSSERQRNTLSKHLHLSSMAGDKSKKEFSVKICSKSKNPQFFSGLSLVKCKTCSKAFAKKESLEAHSLLCNTTSHSYNFSSRKASNRSPSKIERPHSATSNRSVNKTDVRFVADINSDIISEIDNAEVVLEDCQKPLRKVKGPEHLQKQSLLRKHLTEETSVTSHNLSEIGNIDKAKEEVADSEVFEEAKTLLRKNSEDVVSSEETPANIVEVESNVSESEGQNPNRYVRRSLRDRSPMEKSPKKSTVKTDPDQIQSSPRRSMKRRRVSEEVGPSEDEGELNAPRKRALPRRIVSAEASREETPPVEPCEEEVDENVAQSEVSVQADWVSSPEPLPSLSIDENDDGSGESKDESFISDEDLVLLQQRVEAQLGHQISQVSQELRQNSEQTENDDSVRYVEEIWIGKSPGRPTERLKSNRVYVLDSKYRRRGRPICHDSKKIDSLVDENNLKCFQCGELFASVSNIRRHAVRHLGWKRFRCKLCLYSCYHKSEIKVHLLRVHSNRVRHLPESCLGYCFTDLNKEGSRLRAKKRQKTLTKNHTSSSTKTRGGSRDSSASPKRDAEKLSPSREKKVKQPNTAISDTKRFNISTRNSPRVFDTSPLSSEDNMTLRTRKGTYPKKKSDDASETASEKSDKDTNSPSSDSNSRLSNSSAGSSLRSKTRSIEFPKTRSMDNPWVEGFYKRLSGGSLGALRKEQGLHQFRSKSTDFTTSKTQQISVNTAANVSPSKAALKMNSGTGGARSDTSMQHETVTASRNLTQALEEFE